VSSPQLQLARTYLKDMVRPVANRLDAEPEALKQALEGLCRLNLMALRRPAAFGGPALPEREFREFQLEVARYSGALAFLQTQHQSAVSMLAKSTNIALKQRTLPKMHNGELLMAIGFSQLRRVGPPILTAEPEGDEYRIDGELPWVTGFGYYHEILVGATLPDGQSLFFVTPFKKSPQVHFSAPMDLAVMGTAMTVSATVENLRVKPEQVAFIHPPEWIHENDMINVTLQGFFALGCARGSLDIIENAAERKGNPVIQKSAKTLVKEWRDCLDGLVHPPELLEERLKVRAWAIDICGRFAQAAVAVSGGSAAGLDHHAQRLVRESIVYTVSAQTPAIMEATLARLSARS